MSLRFAACPLLALSLFACSSSNDAPSNPPVDSGTTDETGGDSGPQDPLAVACNDTPESIYSDPGTLPADKGAIIRCTRDAPLTKEQVQATLAKWEYTGRPVTSGAHVYRVLYRTERGSNPAIPGTSSALVYLPDTPRAAKLPIVVVGHGSRGQAAACAPSKFSPEGEYVRSDFERLVMPLVGFGYAAIVPDGAGYANWGAAQNPPPAYSSADDIAKTMLDGTRALQKLVPSMLLDKTVIVGHSQGGFTALASLARASAYGAAAPVAATVAYAPLWLAQRSWAAILFLPDDYAFKASPAVNSISIWYHYTTGELLDGPGHGTDVFVPAKRDAIKTFVQSACWGDWSKLYALGEKPTDIFDPTFTDALAATAATGTDCPTDEPKKSLCEKWMARYKADRPKLTGDAANVPILFLYGNQDTTIPPTRVTCARDWLKATGGNVSYCVEPDVDHNGIIRKRGDYVGDWIAAKVLGEKDPGKVCSLTENDIKDPMTGKAAECDPIPPNE